jgi:hypothetical protein
LRQRLKRRNFGFSLLSLFLFFDSLLVDRLSIISKLLLWLTIFLNARPGSFLERDGSFQLAESMLKIFVQKGLFFLDNWAFSMWFVRISQKAYPRTVLVYGMSRFLNFWR